MVDMLEDCSELEIARNATLQRVGRNVVNLQKVEGMLKFLITYVDISAPASQLHAHLNERSKKISRMPLGRLVEDASKVLFSEVEPPSKIPQTIQEPWFSHSFRVEAGKESVWQWRKDLRLVVRERNRVVHQLLSSFDPHSIASCKTLDVQLEQQRAQISIAFKSVESMVAAMRTSWADMLAEMGSEAARLEKEE